jgi:hypothetical protein
VRAIFECPECGHIKDALEENETEPVKTRWCYNFVGHEANGNGLPGRRGMVKTYAEIEENGEMTNPDKAIQKAVEAIDKRLGELEDAINEHRELVKKRAALVGSTSVGSGDIASRVTAGSPTALEIKNILVRSDRNLTVTDIAKEMNRPRAYLYNVMRALRDAGEVEKNANGYYQLVAQDESENN